MSHPVQPAAPGLGAAPCATGKVGRLHPRAHCCWRSKPGPSLLHCVGDSCVLRSGRGGKGQPPPHCCLCCVYWSPSNPRTGSAFTACTAAEPRGTGWLPSKQALPGFPSPADGTRQLPQGFPGGEHAGPLGNSNRQLPAQSWHRDPPCVRELLPALGRAINTFEHTLHCAGWTPRCPLSPLFNSLGKASPA